MNKAKSFVLLCSLSLAIAFCSCRKKDRRYEGTYTGTERYTYQDSGATVYSIDTTYAEEIVATYDNAFLPRSKRYDFVKMSSPEQPWSTGKNEFEDGVYTDMNSGGVLKFIGDSLYIYTTNYSDYVENWDTETWEFKGKRN